MQVDIFVTSGDFPSADQTFTCGYGYVDSLDFIPAIHSFFCKPAEDKVYQILYVVQSKDQNRTIAISVQRNFSVQNIFNIPGETNPPPANVTDIFYMQSKFPPNDPSTGCGYGLIASVDWRPEIHSYFARVNSDQVYEIVHMLYSKTPSVRKIALAVPVVQSVQKIYQIPGGFPGQ